MNTELYMIIAEYEMRDDLPDRGWNLHPSTLSFQPVEAGQVFVGTSDGPSSFKILFVGQKEEAERFFDDINK